MIPFESPEPARETRSSLTTVETLDATIAPASNTLHSTMSLPRLALLAYIALITMASLSPFSGWRDLGLPWFGYLQQPWPRYWTWLDVISNVVAYLPLGSLAVLSLPSRWRQQPRLIDRLGGLTFALLACVALTITLETLQGLLPKRVPSNLDCLTNTIGAALGIALGAHRGFGGKVGAWASWRSVQGLQDWFTPHAAQGILLLILWLIAQWAPQSVWMAVGDVIAWVRLVIPSDWIDLDPEVDAPVVLEGLCATLGIVVSGLVLLQCTRAHAPRTTLLAVLLIATVAARSFSTLVLGRGDNPFDWMGAGAQGGIVCGLLCLMLLTNLPRASRRTIALAALVLWVICANLVPENAYRNIASSEQLTGPWTRLREACALVALVWPFWTGWWLWQRPKPVPES